MNTITDGVRAPLFVPADRPDRFEKAASSGADAVILDLEDAVADSNKPEARSQLRHDFTTLPVIVRVNATGSQWHADDLAAISGQSYAAVMLPKSEDPGQVANVHEALGGHVPVMALIETARGMAAARTIAALEGVSRLVFGSIDYCADLGCAHQQDVLLPARSELVLASRLARIAAPVDGVTARLDDSAETRKDASHARALGMTGKLCIHPKQVSEVIKAFAPTTTEIEWATRVLAAGEGAVSVDGEMVDEPVRIRARAIVAAQLD